MHWEQNRVGIVRPNLSVLSTLVLIIFVRSAVPFTSLLIINYYFVYFYVYTIYTM
jgi:hypothetical protein